MARQLRPTAESALSGNRPLCVGQPEAPRQHLLGGHAFGRRKVPQEGRNRIGFARIERGEERFGLTPEMIEIGASGKVLSHDGFSMKFAWIRKQAARRTCGESGSDEVKWG